jgi:3-phosphoshikimate 1-carboxyvinyltransferase
MTESGAAGSTAPPSPQLFAPADQGLVGRVSVPGDKSISHRALLLGAVNEGPVLVRGFLPSADTLATMRAVQALGVQVERSQPGDLLVRGAGWEGLREPDDVIDVANAGTLIRLLPGILASLPFFTVLTGDASIRSRPMARIVGPLREMGAEVLGRDASTKAPLAIRGGGLIGKEHVLSVASAQVKSCLLLAGLRAEGDTTVVEPGPSRDHTERLLRQGGAAVTRDGPLAGPGTVRISPLPSLQLDEVAVPGDMSSAAFILVAALLVPGSRVTVTGVGLNPTRAGLLHVLQAMGADLTVRSTGPPEEGESLGEITAATSELHGVEVGPDSVPLLIDELPIWALAAAGAQGTSRLRGAAELRVKESDRLSAIADLLRVLGVPVTEHADGLDIQGMPGRWEGGGMVTSRGDHRLAMTGAVAGLASARGVTVDDPACVDVSFPGFAATIDSLRA